MTSLQIAEPFDTLAARARSVGLAPPSQEYEQRQNYYQIAFFQDGYPGKLKDNGELVVHPAYGAYIMEDYIRQYRHSPENSNLLSSLRMVSDAVLARMEPFGDGQVFWYGKDEFVMRAYQKHYSGLTQTAYLKAFYDTFDILGDAKYRLAAERIFNSLLIPIQSGGVLHEWQEEGLLRRYIAEVPTQPLDLVLNGWLSIICLIRDYAVRSNNATAWEVFHTSVQTLETLLPKYDFPTLANSRYSLSGFTYMELLFSKDIKGLEIQDLSVLIPGEGEYRFLPEKASRWQNFLLPETYQRSEKGGICPLKKRLKINVVLSQFSSPKPSLLQLTVAAPKDVTLTPNIMVGEYSPLSASQINTRWQALSPISLKKGVHSLQIPISQEAMTYIGYPTNFIKEFHGKRYNVYHFKHITRLRELSELTRNPVLAAYAQKWEAYVKRWADLPIYQGLEVQKFKVSNV